jgi:hypothetical protein
MMSGKSAEYTSACAVPVREEPIEFEKVDRLQDVLGAGGRGSDSYRVFLVLRFKRETREFFLKKCGAIKREHENYMRTNTRSYFRNKSIIEDVKYIGDEAVEKKIMAHSNRCRYVNDNRFASALTAPTQMSFVQIQMLISKITSMLEDSKTISMLRKGTKGLIGDRILGVDSVFALPVYNDVLPMPNRTVKIPSMKSGKTETKESASSGSAAKSEDDCRWALNMIVVRFLPNALFSTLRPEMVKALNAIVEPDLGETKTNVNADFLSRDGHIEIMKLKDYNRENDENAPEEHRFQNEYLFRSLYERETSPDGKMNPSVSSIPSKHWFVDVDSIELIRSFGPADAKTYDTLFQWKVKGQTPV